MTWHTIPEYPKVYTHFLLTKVSNRPMPELWLQENEAYYLYEVRVTMILNIFMEKP